MNWIVSFIEAAGSLGVAFLMFAENVFPPIPSELIMPLAGYTASQASGAGWAALLLAILAGSLAGAVLWYWIGLKIGTERVKSLSLRYGRWITLTPGEIDQADAWFDRYGGLAVLVGRLVPTVRTFISVPAGMSGMPFWTFLGYTAVGTTAWTALLALAGWLLGSRYTQVSTWFGPAPTAILVAVVAWYLYRVATFRRKLAREERKAPHRGP